jgi:transcriptional regulator with XRE-family HTH domain
MLQLAAIVRHRHRKPISEIVQQLMNVRGYGYNEAERRSGKDAQGRPVISHSFLSKLVSGKAANPSLDKLLALADLFEVPVGQLVDDFNEGMMQSASYQSTRCYLLGEKMQKLRDKRHRDYIAHGIERLIREADEYFETEAGGLPGKPASSRRR